MQFLGEKDTLSLENYVFLMEHLSDEQIIIQYLYFCSVLLIPSHTKVSSLHLYI